MSGRKFLRVELFPTTLSHLMCVSCGRFRVDFAIAVSGDDTDRTSQAGIHKKCINTVKAKRGAP